MKRAAALLLVTMVGLAAAPGPAWSDTRAQRFTLRSTDPTANTGSVVATGPMTGVGRYELAGQGPEPFPGKFVFRNGTVFLIIAPDPPAPRFDPQTCVLYLSTSGTFTITGGTGAFSGVSGDGRFAGQAVVVFKKDPRGECRRQEAPVLFLGVVDEIASVTLP